jgi:hypothetical protein
MRHPAPETGKCGFTAVPALSPENLRREISFFPGREFS